MTQDVRSFPVEAYPEGEELDRLRSEFVQYQYRFHQFSDFYAIVARFAWEKSREAVAAAIADQSPKGRDPERGSMRSTRAAVAKPIAQPPPAQPPIEEQQS